MTAAKRKLKQTKARIRNGYHVNISADVIVLELEKIRKNTGDVTPEEVVEAARDPKSPLHQHFEWDDTKAAAKFRLDQARYLIRSVEVEYESIPMGRSRKIEIVTTPAYVNPRPRGTPEGQPYHRTVDVLDDPTLRAALLEEAIRDINRFKIKYAILDELSGVLDQMNKVLQRQAKKRKK